MDPVQYNAQDYKSYRLTNPSSLENSPYDIRPKAAGYVDAQESIDDPYVKNLQAQICKLEGFKDDLDKKENIICRLQEDNRKLKSNNTEVIKLGHVVDQLKMQNSQKDVEIARITDQLQNTTHSYEEKLSQMNLNIQWDKENKGKDFQEMKAVIDRLESENTALKQELTKADGEIKKAEDFINSTLQVCKDKDMNLQMIEKSSDKREKAMNGQLVQVTREKEKSEQTTRELFQILQGMEEKVKTLPGMEEQLQKATHNAEKYRKKFKNVQNAFDSQKQQDNDKIIQYRDELDSASTQLSRQSTIISELRKHLQSLDSEYKTVSSAKQQVDGELNKLTQKLETEDKSIQEKVARYRNELQDLAKENDQMRRELLTYREKEELLTLKQEEMARWKGEMTNQRNSELSRLNDAIERIVK